MEKKLLAALMLTVCSGVAVASPQNTDMSGSSAQGIGKKAINSSFENLDGDSDGFLSREDVAEVMEPTRDYAKADADQDGKLSKAEYNDYIKIAHGQGHGGAGQQTSVLLPSFKKLDSDKDGTISQSEYDNVKGQLQGNSGRVQGSATQSITPSTPNTEPDFIVIPVPPGANALIVPAP